jgi:predicted CoA-binding protein
MDKSTLVIGASLKDNKYSNICVRTLISGHFPVTAIGLREGMIDTTPVLSVAPELSNIHTVTLYLNADNQKPWYEYILKLNPKRVVFNPGAENDEFTEMLTAAGIETVEDCTIMMVQYCRY